MKADSSEARKTKSPAQSSGSPLRWPSGVPAGCGRSVPSSRHTQRSQYPCLGHSRLHRVHPDIELAQFGSRSQRHGEDGPLRGGVDKPPCCPWSAAIEEVLMIDPPPFARIAGMACLIPKNVPFWFTEVTSRSRPRSFLKRPDDHDAGVVHHHIQAGRRSGQPTRRAFHVIFARHVGRDVEASPPAARMASTVASARPSVRQSLTTTRAPSPANAIATARPMPEPAPVTIADFSGQSVHVDLQDMANARASTTAYHRVVAPPSRPPSVVCWARARLGSGGISEETMHRAATHAGCSNPALLYHSRGLRLHW